MNIMIAFFSFPPVRLIVFLVLDPFFFFILTQKTCGADAGTIIGGFRSIFSGSRVAAGEGRDGRLCALRRVALKAEPVAGRAFPTEDAREPGRAREILEPVLLIVVGVELVLVRLLLGIGERDAGAVVGRI